MKKNVAAKNVVLTVVLAGLLLYMAGDYFGFTGSSAPPASTSANAETTAQVQGDVQEITTVLSSRKYAPITVQAGIPVKWTIKADAKSINGCNGTMTIPAYGIEHKFTPGDNVITFTPTEAGTIPYSCWMGMITSEINVTDNQTSRTNDDNISLLSQTNARPVDASNDAGNVPFDNVVYANDGSSTTQISDDQVKIADVKDGEQIVNVTVTPSGYAPEVVVLQKGIKTKFVFDAPDAQLNGCNQYVLFPQLNDYIDLSTTKETPYFTPSDSFSYQCAMGMLGAYVAVVDDISKVDLAKIKADAIASGLDNSGAGGCSMSAGSGGGSCCGN